jgi:hypothetical protein
MLTVFCLLGFLVFVGFWIGFFYWLKVTIP